jgi:hypothetical protein
MILGQNLHGGVVRLIDILWFFGVIFPAWSKNLGIGAGEWL